MYAVQAYKRVFKRAGSVRQCVDIKFSYPTLRHQYIYLYQGNALVNQKPNVFTSNEERKRGFSLSSSLFFPLSSEVFVLVFMEFLCANVPPFRLLISNSRKNDLRDRFQSILPSRHKWANSDIGISLCGTKGQLCIGNCGQ